MPLFGRKAKAPKPMPGLHKDAATPIGTIWSAVEPEADGLASGDLLDAERLLGVGDIINVRSRPGGAKRFALRVTGRDDDVVHTERVRH